MTHNPSTTRLYIANRGEIALRVIRAARLLGIETVLGVSKADIDSVPATEASRTVVLGPAAPRLSYLNTGLVVHAAKATGCSLLHPGYGFLSERAELAELCEEEGITFIGPTARSIRQVGDKLSARAAAQAAGVPITVGSQSIQDTTQALIIANQIGYPVITKASAGGGGRGMIVARNADTLRRNFDVAATAAREAFGDGTLYLERYVETARHIEVQVMGDGAGRAFHFGERDCSVQRRFQKMIEESPAQILPSRVRKRLHQCATDLLASINYRNAGTVEFLYDVDRQEFSFMEVNARIQVEHPVSEEVTARNLIRMQIELASGRLPPLTQQSIHVNGHAIEARILAEDPQRDFMPTPGRITKWQEPRGDGIRVDSALRSGASVPPFYDSMIAKLVVHAGTRAKAIDRLRWALDQFVIEGVPTNIPLLKVIVDHQDFRRNQITTRWLEDTLLPSFRGAEAIANG